MPGSFPNLLTVLKNIVDFKTNDLNSYSTTFPNRINVGGQKLEFYVRDAVCGSFRYSMEYKEKEYTKGVFSLRGNQNNPPDFIIEQGDAYEIKKIEALKASIALNNSHPKDKLHRDDPRITEECRKIEGGKWTTKDIFYVVGHVQGGKIKYLFFVHGLCYAASRDYYAGKASALKKSIDNCIKSGGWEATTKTIELGRINRMDPLGITNFRIRGMWEIENPIKVFSYVYSLDTRKDFSLIALMTKEKYESFAKDTPIIDNDNRFVVNSVSVKNPNNPAKLMDAKLVTSWW
jgi:hypothetical protein